MEKEEIIQLVENCLNKFMKNVDEKFEEFYNDFSAHNSTQNEKFESLISNEDKKSSEKPKTDERDSTEIFAESLKLLSNEMKKATRPTKNLRFDDIQRSFKEFHGDKHLSIDSWLRHFIDQSEIFNLDDFEKFVYAKRLLKGTAKLFVEFESKATNWEELARELIDEFDRKVNSALIHHRLQERKKKQDETSTEYLYEMLSIASLTDIDIPAIITYTVNGLPGSTIMKSFMYEAENLKEFKKKLLSYDIQQGILKKEQMFNEKTSEDNKKHICFNCGDRKHQAPFCPMKDKGPKCFKCNEYGHISSSCFSSTSTNNSSGNQKLNKISIIKKIDKNDTIESNNCDKNNKESYEWECESESSTEDEIQDIEYNKQERFGRINCIKRIIETNEKILEDPIGKNEIWKNKREITLNQLSDMTKDEVNNWIKENQQTSNNEKIENKKLKMFHKIKKYIKSFQKFKEGGV